MVLVSRKTLRLLTPEIIDRAMKLNRLEARASKLRIALAAIEEAMSELDQSSGSRITPRTAVKSVAPVQPVQRKRKKFSKAARLRMKAAAVLRWKKIKEAKAEPAKEAATS